MHSDTPLAFHRRRISQLSNTIGAWRQCMNSSCRRAGACRRAADVFPPCLLPIVREVNVSIAGCLAAVPGLPPRVEPVEETNGAQIDRLNKRVADLVEAEVERMERAQEKRRVG
jgi:hypothetical protein